MRTTIVAAVMAVMAAAAAVAGPAHYEDETQFLARLWGEDVIWVNFDTDPSGSGVPTGQTLIGNEWSSLGVTFTSPGNTLVTSATGIGTASSPPNYLSVVDGGTGNENLTMSFDIPAFAVGFTLLGPAYPGGVVTFQGDSGAIAVFELPYLGWDPGLADPSFFVGLISGDPIVAVEIVRPTYPDDPIGFDDVIFQPVPEPATLILLGLGAAGLVWRRRGKR